MSLIDSEMAGQIRLKLGGMIKGMQENVLAKEFFESVNVDRGWVGGPQVPLLGRGDDKETQMMELVGRKWPMIRSATLRKVTRARSMDHRCLF